ncbi:hypothetical protein MRBLBA21_005041 [Peribacillus frigoritolerans]|uniref:hypothetical protein n=1 Tax=Peribacillus frigoritolerans TaxID=450367 RepID=UPI000BED19EF|nr:hypothetical protein [Peribacillus frigoritolerans]MCR8871992.1 hypothetical protein [Peribacillus frigoritolerans]PEF36917.1 hypothetical protein CON84_18705 [Bacillus sp. AFS094228]
MNFVCTPEERKQEVADLLKELKVPYEFMGNTRIKIFGKSDIFGEFLVTGHVNVYKYSRDLKRDVRKHRLATMKAIESYMRKHAI